LIFNLKQRKLFYINYNLDELFLFHCNVVVFIEQILYSNFETKSDERDNHDNTKHENKKF